MIATGTDHKSPHLSANMVGAAVAGIWFFGLMLLAAWVVASMVYRYAFPPHVVATQNLGAVVAVDVDRWHAAIRAERGTIILEHGGFIPRGNMALEAMSDGSIHAVVDGQRFYYHKSMPLWPWDFAVPRDFVPVKETP